MRSAYTSILFAGLLLLKVVFLQGSSATQFASLKDKTLLFVSGWPQSGTSLLQQILTITPGVRTMVEKCDQVHGSKCQNWNHEGQWLLPRSHEISPYLQPGKMCPVPEEKANPPSGTKEAILSNWLKYWHTNEDSSDVLPDILVEKSPQSMLKIPFLVEVLKGQPVRKLKFLILLKHPVTLNVATPAGMSWMTNTNAASPSMATSSQDQFRKKAAVSSVSSSSQSQSEAAWDSAVFNTDEEIADSVRHFLHFAAHHEVQKHEYGKSHPSKETYNYECSSMGWIPAVDTLLEQLKAVKNAKISGASSDKGGGANFGSKTDKNDEEGVEIDVGILRYEYFQRPYRLCQAVLGFIFDLSFDDVEALSSSYYETSNPALNSEKENQKYKQYLKFKTGVKEVCDEHFHARKEHSSATSQNRPGAGAATSSTMGLKKAVKPIVFRRPRGKDSRKLWIWNAARDQEKKDNDEVASSQVYTEVETADVYTAEDGGDAGDDDDVDPRVASRHHGAHEGGIKIQGRKKKLAAKLDQQHLQRLRHRNKQAGRLQSRRWRRKKMTNAAGGNLRGTKRNPLSRGLRLKEQSEARKVGLDFEPRIVRNSLIARLREFENMYTEKSVFLKQSAYKASAMRLTNDQLSEVDNGRLGAARQHIRSVSNLKVGTRAGDTLSKGLEELEERMRSYGYSLRPDYNLFYKQPSLLDPWDIVKRWRSRGYVVTSG